MKMYKAIPMLIEQGKEIYDYQGHKQKFMVIQNPYSKIFL